MSVTRLLPPVFLIVILTVGFHGQAEQHGQREPCEFLLELENGSASAFSEIGLLRRYFSWKSRFDFLLKPLVTLAESNDREIVVLGSPFEDRQLASRFLSLSEEFTRFYRGWGLQPPRQLAIVISGWTGLPMLPVSFPFIEERMFIPVRWEMRSVLAMMRGAPRGTARNRLVLYHELIHKLLLETFGMKSFIYKSVQMNEALADFLPAHFAGLSMQESQAITKVNRWSEFITGRQGSFGTHTRLLPELLQEIFQFIPQEEQAKFLVRLLNEMNANAHLSGCLELQFTDIQYMRDQNFLALLKCNAAFLLTSAQKLMPDHRGLQELNRSMAIYLRNQSEFHNLERVLPEPRSGVQPVNHGPLWPNYHESHPLVSLSLATALTAVDLGLAYQVLEWFSR